MGLSVTSGLSLFFRPLQGGGGGWAALAFLEKSILEANSLWPEGAFKLIMNHFVVIIQASVVGFLERRQVGTACGFE